MRNLVLCFDGTWKREDQPHPTNVVKTFQAIRRKVGRISQVPYYDRGVGSGRLDRLRGGAFGIGLTKNVEQGYAWLAKAYQPGDRLYFFGFSRGAYTARSLAGLVGLCGIPDHTRWPGLKPEAVVRNGLRIYRQRNGPGRQEEALTYAGRYGHLHAGTREPVRQVWFIGVWDTVGSLGVPFDGLRWLTGWRHQFHDVELSSQVRYAYHAVAIDENRRPSSRRSGVAPWLTDRPSNNSGSQVSTEASAEAFPRPAFRTARYSGCGCRLRTLASSCAAQPSLQTSSGS